MSTTFLQQVLLVCQQANSRLILQRRPRLERPLLVLRILMHLHLPQLTTAYPGVVATQIRYRGLNAQGVAAGSSGLKEDDAMSVEECARLILEGMAHRRREVVMTARGKLARFVKLVAPGRVEDMALAALKDEVKPH